MLYYVRIQVSEEIDVNMTSVSKECDICRYWYFLNKGLKFQPNIYNRCHSLLMMFILVLLVDLGILKQQN